MWASGNQFIPWLCEIERAILGQQGSNKHGKKWWEIDLEGDIKAGSWCMEFCCGSESLQAWGLLVIDLYPSTVWVWGCWVGVAGFWVYVVRAEYYH